jgi:TetR/AcrR family transcriptional regulator
METRERLLEVAETQFACKGFAGAHLQRIAEEVGVQKTALYYYFPSKAALYVDVLSQMIDDFDRTVSTAVGRDLAYRPRLEGLLDDLNDLMAEKRNYSMILIRVFADHSGVDLGSLSDTIQRIVTSILDFYTEGAKAGVFRKISSRHFFQTVLGSIVFHYAAAGFSGRILGVEDAFARSAVAWRRDEVRRVLTEGVLVERDDP